jgi:hypothetical protein
LDGAHTYKRYIAYCDSIKLIDQQSQRPSERQDKQQPSADLRMKPKTNQQQRLDDRAPKVKGSRTRLAGYSYDSKQRKRGDCPKGHGRPKQTRERARTLLLHCWNAI